MPAMGGITLNFTARTSYKTKRTTCINTNTQLHIHTQTQICDLYIYYTVGECIALWGEPNELSIHHLVYIFMQYVAR